MEDCIKTLHRIFKPIVEKQEVVHVTKSAIIKAKRYRLVASRRFGIRIDNLHQLQFLPGVGEFSLVDFW